MEERFIQYQQEVAIANKAVWDGINALVSAQREWNALDYGKMQVEGSSETGAVVFDTANALVTLLNTGHATNMAKLL
jgi:hypothetical protein